MLCAIRQYALDSLRALTLAVKSCLRPFRRSSCSAEAINGQGTSQAEQEQQAKADHGGEAEKEEGEAGEEVAVSVGNPRRAPRAGPLIPVVAVRAAGYISAPQWPTCRSASSPNRTARRSSSRTSPSTSLPANATASPDPTVPASPPS